MPQLTERDSRAALWAYWALAFQDRIEEFKKARKSRPADASGGGAYEKMETFCERARPFIDPVDAVAPYENDASCGFSPSRRVFWIRTRMAGQDAYASGFGRAAALDESFGPGKAIPNTLRAFTGSALFDKIARTGEVPTKFLNKSARRVLAAILGEDRPTVPFVGAWVVGYDKQHRGHYLLGARRFAATANLTCEEIAQRLQLPEAIVVPVETSVSPAWLDDVERKRVAAAILNDKELYRRVCHEVFPEEEAIIVCDPAGTDAVGLLAHELSRVKEGNGESTQTVLVASCNTSASITPVVHGALGRSAWTGLTVRTLEAADGANRIGLVPWLWSKYFGPDAFAVIRNDPQHLAGMLVHRDLTRRLLFHKEIIAPVHPVLRDYALESGARVAVIGPERSGKSVAIFQLLGTLRDHVIVVLRSSCDDPTWRKVLSLVRFLDAAGYALAFVMEDLHAPLGSGGLDARFGDLAALVGPVHAPRLRRRPTVIVSYATEFRDTVRKALPELARYAVLRTDACPAPFLRGVINAHRYVLGRDLLPDPVATLRLVFQLGEQRLGAMLDYCIQGGIPADEAYWDREDERWGVRYQDLLSRGLQAEHEIIRVVAWLAAWGVDRAGLAFLQDGFHAVAGANCAFLRPLDTVCLEGWLQRDADTLSWRTSRFSCVLTTDDEGVGRKLALWAAAHAIPEQVDCEQLLTCATFSLHDTADFLVVTRRALCSLQDLRPGNLRLLLNGLAGAHEQCGNVQTYLADIRDILQVNTNPGRVLTHVVHQILYDRFNGSTEDACRTFATPEGIEHLLAFLADSTTPTAHEERRRIREWIETLGR